MDVSCSSCSADPDQRPESSWQRALQEPVRSLFPGMVQPLFEWAAAPNTTFGVADMGRRFLVAEQARESNNSLTLLVNWQDRLK